MIARTLRQLLVAPATADRLRELAADAPAATLVSLHIDLDAHGDNWLACLPAGQAWWYRARPAAGEFRLGIGHALHVESAGPNRFAALDHAYAGLCRNWRRNGDAHAFAGFAFDPAGGAPLPNARLAVPTLLLQSLGGRSSLVVSAPAGRLDAALAESAEWLARPMPPRPLPVVAPPRPDELGAQAWCARVGAALRDIAAGGLVKVVLSRSRTLTAPAPIPPAAVLARLLAQQPEATIYGHGLGEQAFLGATPERLVRLCAGEIAVDALAGTAWPGSLALAEAKNRHEQRLVVDAICAALAGHCHAPPRVGAASEHPAGALRHWRSPISATALPATRLFDLVRALHPTPAVGGFPGDAAERWLAAHGESRPGWYSGGIGLLDANGDGELSVALRCALLDGRRATLQAGAGIVAGSDPVQELAETEAKLGTLLAALMPDPQAGARRA